VQKRRRTKNFLETFLFSSLQTRDNILVVLILQS
jgi:hypothetical protein